MKTKIDMVKSEIQTLKRIFELCDLLLATMISIVVVLITAIVYMFDILAKSSKCKNKDK